MFMHLPRHVGVHRIVSLCVRVCACVCYVGKFLCVCECVRVQLLR